MLTFANLRLTFVFSSDQHEILGQNVPVLGWEVCQLGVSGECLDYENVR